VSYRREMESAATPTWKPQCLQGFIWSYLTLSLLILKYRVSQEERSIFWEVIVSVILSKKLHMNMCPIPNGFQDRAIWMQTSKFLIRKRYYEYVLFLIPVFIVQVTSCYSL
jgi:hypothetical protein